MVNFGEYLEENKDFEWSEYYIDYNQCKILLQELIDMKPDSFKIFTKFLDKEWMRYYNFINQKIYQLNNLEVNKELMIEIIRINQFINLNQEAIRKIVKKHDKNSTKIKLLPSWHWKVFYNPREKLFKIIKTISNLYNNRFEEKESKIDNINFNRKSIKYWVKKSDVLPLISLIIPNLPIYLFNDLGDESIYQPISSVYFDNDECHCYHERINKKQGSKLFRIRWYNNDMKRVFLERKTHQEDWTNKDSMKERFTLNNNDVMPFLRGSKKVDNELANDIFKLVTNNKLYPKVRTQYERISFQKRHTNEIRISLDLNLKMIKEKTSHLQWFTDEEDILDEDIYNFPYTILEVKLSGNNVDNPPKWISKLMNSDMLIEKKKFSKFGHSIYTFYHDRCEVEPYWFNDNNLFEKKINDSIIITVNDSKCFNFKKCITFSNSKTLSNQVKIEPKTFFANERTYLQWFNSSLFISTIGLALNTYNNTNTLSYILIAISILMVIYSTVVYYRRNYFLKNMFATGYHDNWGPIIMSSVVSFAFIISLIIN